MKNTVKKAKYLYSLTTLLSLICVHQVSSADGLKTDYKIKDQKEISKTVDNKYYSKLDIAITSPDKVNRTTFKDVPTVSGAVGYHINDVFRTDVELNYDNLKTKGTNLSGSFNSKPDIKHYGLLLNGYINLTDRDDDFIPYVSGSIGYGYNKLSSFKVISSNGNSSLSQNGKATKSLNWGIGVGGVAKFNEKFGLDLGYRYMNLGKVQGTSVISSGSSSISSKINIDKLWSHNFYVGLAMNF